MLSHTASRESTVHQQGATVYATRRTEEAMWCRAERATQHNYFGLQWVLVSSAVQCKERVQAFGTV